MKKINKENFEKIVNERDLLEIGEKYIKGAIYKEFLESRLDFSKKNASLILRWFHKTTFTNSEKLILINGITAYIVQEVKEENIRVRDLLENMAGHTFFSIYSSVYSEKLYRINKHCNYLEQQKEQAIKVIEKRVNPEETGIMCIDEDYDFYHFQTRVRDVTKPLFFDAEKLIREKIIEKKKELKPSATVEVSNKLRKKL